MFCPVRLALRGRRPKLPHAIASLPAPSLRTKWGMIGRMSADDKREVLRGAWRQATPVRLLPDAADRDAGGFVDGVSFRTDEEAAAFLAEEMRADTDEHDVPALQLARSFFDELARAADDEVDVENSGGAPAAASDAEREEEAAHASRCFFADFYVRQRLVGGENKSEFVDAMLRPPAAIMAVNPALPFVRFVVRWQLERHAVMNLRFGGGVVFLPHAAHPLLYTVQMVPAQRFGDPLRLPYTHDREAEETLTLEGYENDVNASSASCGALPSCTSLPAETELVENIEVDLMESLLNDDNDKGGVQNEPMMNEADMRKEKNKEIINDETSEERISEVLEKGGSSALQPEIPRAPLSIGHMYWLQRQIASDTLIDMDILGVMLPLAIGICRKEGNDNHNVTILDMSSRSFSTEQFSYSKDIAGHFAVSRATGAEEWDKASKAVIVSLLLPKSGEKKARYHHHHQHHRSGGGLQGLKATVEDVPEDEGVLGGERFHTSGYHVGIENRLVVRCNPKHVWDALSGRCDGVLCCPSTSADGRKSRTVLGASGGGQREGEEEDEAVANRFITVCSKVNKVFPYLRRELAQALEYAQPEGGVVVYATQSMNPLENEAVVCSVLTDFKRKYPGREYMPVSLLDHHTEEDREVLRSFTAKGQHGLQTWVPLEDGPPEQDPSYCDEGIVSSVSRHAWRASPLRCDGDVCFICVIQLRGSLPKLSSPTSLPLSVGQTDAAQPQQLSAFPWLDTVRLRDRWGLLIHRSRIRKSFVAVTPEALQMVNALEASQHHAKDCDITDYGVSIESGSEVDSRSLKCIISPSISGTRLATALCNSTHAEYRSSCILQLHVMALLELLHARSITLQRACELSGGFPLEWNTESPSDKGTRTVFLKAVVNMVDESEMNPMKMHEAVRSELDSLVVVAKATVRRCAESQTDTTVLTIECGTMRERRELEERVVAIGDALRYLLRRLGYPAGAWGPASTASAEYPQVLDDEYEVETHQTSSSSSSLSASSTTASADAVDNLLGSRARQHHRRRMHKLGSAVRRLGGSVENGPVNDWEKDVKHRRRSKRSSITPFSVRKF